MTSLKQSRTVVLTYDYELFFNRSGTVSRCLLEPTNHILKLARQYGGMASTFFVDATHLLRCRDTNGSAREEYENIASQLQSIVAEGHRIELHLHPHWLDAVREGKTWQFPDYRRYRLHALTPMEIRSLFISGVQVLQEIASGVQSDYRIRAFRAGGWSIQPSMQIIQAMIAAGVNIDSSVGPGCFSTSRTHHFDFRAVSVKKPYFFTYDVTCPDGDGPCVEVPISTFRIKFIDRLAKRLEIFCAPNSGQPFGDGIGMQVPTQYAGFYSTMLRKFRTETTFLSLDNLSPYTLKRELQCENNYLCFISHPKLMSIKSLKLLELLASDIKNKFMTVGEVASKIRKENADSLSI
ncbi:MAG: hypothetical protein WBF69_03085 [Castellaniella sp.]|uniref:hypothetical protein n=1 Tax=Castellaniella sp. TaxID=1955812 RepID=UPI003C737798